MAELYEYNDRTGIVTPETGEVRNDIEQEYLTAFGSGFSVNASTPQGKMITADTIVRSSVIAFNAGIANQINPNLSGGIFLRSLMALMGIEPIGAYPTLVACTLTGVAGTVIPSNSFARDTNGNVFLSIDEIVLDSEGEATEVMFQASVLGPIDVAIGALSLIVSGVLGWETITNPAAGVTGRFEQSDPAARRYRNDTLGVQGQSQDEAIIGGLYTVTGVDSVSYRDNDTDDTVVYQGVTLLPHSMYACVSGGLNSDIANMIRRKKNGGCNYNGTITVNSVSPVSGQVYPIKFDRPDLLPVLVRVNIRVATSVIDPEEQVRAAVLAYAAGEIREQAGFGIGKSVSSFEIAGAIASETTGIYVVSVETTFASVIDYSSDEIPILINQRATIVDSSITVNIV